MPSYALLNSIFLFTSIKAYATAVKLQKRLKVAVFLKKAKKKSQTALQEFLITNPGSDGFTY